MKAPEERFGATAIALHWVSVVLIATNLLLGLSMVRLPISPMKLQWYLVHKSIGISVLVLTGARLAWRAMRPYPAPVPMPFWQRRAAVATHALLYVLLFAIPLSGWLYSSATGVQVLYLGLIPLPDLVPRDKALAGGLKVVHVTLNFAMLILICIHAAAALKHHFFDRDAVLTRMLPRIKSPRELR